MEAHAQAQDHGQYLQPWDITIKALGPDGTLTARTDATSADGAFDAIHEAMGKAGFASGTWEIQVVKHAPGDRSYYEITRQDVGRSVIEAFGKHWLVSSFLGSVLPSDVGKRVYLFGQTAADRGYLQAENDGQLAARLASQP